MTRRALAALAFAVLLLAGSGHAGVPTKGHVLVPPYPGAALGEPAVVVDFDEYDLPTGPIKDGKVSKSLRLEGKITMFYYENPEGRSLTEIYRNYESAFTKAGFTTLFSCKGGQCGVQLPFKGLGYMPNGAEARYLAVKLPRTEGDVFIGMHVEPNDTKFVVIEVKPMDSGLIKVSADALKKDLLEAGHVAVYEILFDTAKADLKPESQGALKEIASLLAKVPSLKLHVVGHTDNEGNLAQNVDLSRRRAASVVAALVATYRVPANRLHPEGVGPFAPVASNDQPSGRAKNRRVELVKQ